MNPRAWSDSPADESDQDDLLDDPEGPQACDLVSNGDADDYETVACPRCGREISELAEQCPHCGDWIVGGARGGAKRKPLLIVIAILLLILVVLWVF